MANNNGPADARSIYTSRSKRMEAYDRLPKGVRKALQEANLPWATETIRPSMRKHKLKVKDIVALIRSQDARNADLYYEKMASGFRD